MLSLSAIILVVAIAVLAIGAIAQVLALYHFVRYLGSQTPQQRWTRSLLGMFALLWTRGLSDKALRHLALFVRWEAVFLAMFAVIAIGDIVMKQQPNNFIPASAPTADARR